MNFITRVHARLRTVNPDNLVGDTACALMVIYLIVLVGERLAQ